MGDLFTKPDAKAGSINSGPSPDIWSQSPGAQIAAGDWGVGFKVEDRFTSFLDTHNWVLTQATAGTVAMDPAAKGGALLLDCNSTTNNQGVQIQYGGAAGASSFIASAHSKIYYETRLKVADIGSTTCQIFAGLAPVDTSVFASAANSTANHIGFEAINTTSVTFATEKAGTRVADTSAATIADDTYIKLGFLVDGLTSVTPYVNGVAGTTQTSSIPIVDLTPSFVCHSSGTTDPILHLDWVRVIQQEEIAN